MARGIPASMARPSHRSARALAATGVAVALTLGACGSDDEGTPVVPPPKPEPSAAPAARARFESRGSVFSGRARPAAADVGIAGTIVSGEGELVVVVDLLLENRSERTQRVGPITAVLRDGAGRVDDEVALPGEDSDAPLFPDGPIRPGERVRASAIYRVSPGDLRGTSLRVRDPARRMSYRLVLF